MNSARRPVRGAFFFTIMVIVRKYYACYTVNRVDRVDRLCYYKGVEVNRMTGREWNKYFKTLTPEYKRELVRALNTLNTDEVFHREFGTSFYELMAIIQFPLDETVPHNVG